MELNEIRNWLYEDVKESNEKILKEPYHHSDTGAPNSNSLEGYAKELVGNWTHPDDFYQGAVKRAVVSGEKYPPAMMKYAEIVEPLYKVLDDFAKFTKGKAEYRFPESGDAGNWLKGENGVDSFRAFSYWEEIGENPKFTDDGLAKSWSKVTHLKRTLVPILKKAMADFGFAKRLNSAYDQTWALSKKNEVVLLAWFKKIITSGAFDLAKYNKARERF